MSGEREQELERLSAHIEPLVVAIVGTAEALQMAAARYFHVSAGRLVDMAKVFSTPFALGSPLTAAAKKLFWAQSAADSIVTALCSKPEFDAYVRLLNVSTQADYEDELGRDTVLLVLAALIQITANAVFDPINMDAPAHLRRLLEQMGVVADLPDEGPLELRGLAEWIGGPDKNDLMQQTGARANAAQLADHTSQMMRACAQAGYPSQQLAGVLGLPDSARLSQWLAEAGPDPQSDA